MKRNNKGFTLVELIVVLAIMGIVAALIGLSVSTSNSAKAQRCAVSVNALISKCRADSLGRSGSVYLTISQDATSGEIVCVHSDGTTTVTDKFPGKGVSVTCTTTSTAPLTTLTLSFARSTGAQNCTPTCTTITFTSGRTYTITLVPLTGNHRLT